MVCSFILMSFSVGVRTLVFVALVGFGGIIILSPEIGRETFGRRAESSERALNLNRLSCL